MSVSWADDALQAIDATQELCNDTSDTEKQPSCTQHVTITQESVFGMYENDPDSVQETGIIACFRDENKNHVLEPKYFFLEDNTVYAGSGHRSDKSEVKFDGMEKVGMSDCAFLFSLSEEPSVLSLTSYNSNVVKLHRATGTIISIRQGDEDIPLYQGDFIRFDDFGQHSGCDILFHNAPEGPIDRNDSEAGASGSEKSTDLSRGRAYALLQIDSKISSLNICREAIQVATDVKTIETLLAAVDGQADSSGSLERKRPPVRRDDISDRQPKRKKVDSQERRHFHQSLSQVDNAIQLLSKAAGRPTGKQKRKCQLARETIANAMKTVCYYDKHGGCRNGDSCPFLHQGNADTSMVSRRGVLYKWNEHGKRGAFGFIRLEDTGEELFCTLRSFVDKSKKLEESTCVLVGGITQPNGKKPGQLNEAIEVRFD